MTRQDTLARLQHFVAERLLDGEGGDLTPATPLLELGVIDSWSMVHLVRFIETEFGTKVPVELMVPTSFKDLDALTDLVLKLQAG